MSCWKGLLIVILSEKRSFLCSYFFLVEGGVVGLMKRMEWGGCILAPCEM